MVQDTIDKATEVAKQFGATVKISISTDIDSTRTKIQLVGGTATFSNADKVVDALDESGADYFFDYADDSCVQISHIQDF